MPSSSAWEVFRDPTYYDMWAVRHRAYRKLEEAYHLPTEAEARHLAKILNYALVDPGKVRKHGS